MSLVAAPPEAETSLVRGTAVVPVDRLQVLHQVRAGGVGRGPCGHAGRAEGKVAAAAGVGGETRVRHRRRPPVGCGPAARPSDDRRGPVPRLAGRGVCRIRPPQRGARPAPELGGSAPGRPAYPAPAPGLVRPSHRRGVRAGRRHRRPGPAGVGRPVAGAHRRHRHPARSRRPHRSRRSGAPRAVRRPAAADPGRPR